MLAILILCAQGYQTNFDDATGWTLSAGVNGVKWKVDSTPNAMVGGSYHSAPTSINYNNGTTYNSGSTSTNSGTAAFGPVTLAANPTLTFWCNFKTEPGSDDANYGKDVRTLTLTPDAGAAVVEKLGVTNSGALVGPCSAMGTWHEHAIALDPKWKTVTVEFKFDSGDATANSHPGWFIDDFAITGKPAAAALDPVKTWNFDGGLDGWTATSSNAGVTWEADATPSAVKGGAFASAPSSLNYNNGTNYDAGMTNKGDCTSPEFSLQGLESPVLVFACNFDSESSPSWDKRFVQISNDGFATTLLDVQLRTSGTLGGVENCAASGTWHTHTVPLDPAWGAVTFRFKFDTINSYYNTGAGWFVDDVMVQVPTKVVEGSTESGETDEEPKRRWCGGSVAEGAMPRLPFALAAVLLLLLLRTRR